jgi:hypothetical protein
MAQCPSCHNEVKPDERFCENCGARLEPSLAGPTPTGDQPQRPKTGKETVVLPSLTDINLKPPVAPSQPAPDATIVSPPAKPPQPPTSEPAMPGRAPSEPTIISPPVHTPTMPLGQPPSGYPASTVPPAAQKSGGNVWKILAIIAGIGVLACVALAVGAVLFLNRIGQQVGPVFSSINSGLLETSIAEPAGGAAATSAPRPTSTPRPTAAPQATAAATGPALLLEDDFADAASSDFAEGESENASYAFVGGAYEMTVKQPNLIVWKTVRGEYGDAAISVDATIGATEGTATGLLFHYQDDKNFYIFTITDDRRYGLDMYKDDQLTTLIDWTESAAINAPGNVNALRIETAGGTIRLYANDQLLDEVSDSTFARGKVAITVNSFDNAGASTTFDNLVIQDIE